MRSLLPLLLLPLLLLTLLLPLGGCSKKPDARASAQQFFEQIGAGQVEAAYQTAAFGFQAQRNATLFAAAAKDMGLTEYASAEWGQPEREPHSAKFSVKIKTRGGKEIPLIVTMVNETGAWRVFSMRSPPSEDTGVSENRFSLVGKAPSLTDAIAKPAPPENEIRPLVRETLLRFNEAIATNSFDAFYESVSLKWQDQLTKGQLQRAFQPFVDRKVSLREVEKLPLVFDTPPAVNSEGLLIVNGHYAGDPYTIKFSMKFFYELPTWKLFGLDLNLIK